MKTILTALLAVGGATLLAGAEPYLSPSDLPAGQVLPNSTAPNGQFCFIEGFKGPTTGTAIVLASADRQRVLASAELATLFSTDRPYKGRITIVWSPDSTRVAMHDAINKNSTLAILRAAGNTFESVSVPDLLAAACARWGIARTRVATSGQRPLRWSDDILTVEVSARLKDGGSRTVTLPLHAPVDGAPRVKAQ